MIHKSTERIVKFMIFLLTIGLMLASIMVGVCVGKAIANREFERRAAENMIAVQEAAAVDEVPQRSDRLLDEAVVVIEPAEEAAAPLEEIENTVIEETSPVPQEAVEPITEDPPAEPAPEIAAEPESEFAPEPAQVSASYYRADIPLSSEEQLQLWEACQEFGVPYELALAVIWQETHFMNVDSGACQGYMQIMPKWVWPEMEQLGATDLMIPRDNFRVGCCLLSKFISQHGIAGGLTRYNTGSPGHNSYATAVMSKWEKLKSGEVTI